MTLRLSSPLIDLQEASGWRCDTGSDVAVLEVDFADANLDFSDVPADWNSKKGPWAPTDDALAERAIRVRRWLKERPEKQIVVVTHAGFLHLLTQDSVPFENTEWRTYKFASYGQDEDEKAKLDRVHHGSEVQKP